MVTWNPEISRPGGPPTTTAPEPSHCSPQTPEVSLSEAGLVLCFSWLASALSRPGGDVSRAPVRRAFPGGSLKEFREVARFGKPQRVGGLGDALFRVDDEHLKGSVERAALALRFSFVFEFASYQSEGGHRVVPLGVADVEPTRPDRPSTPRYFTSGARGSLLDFRRPKRTRRSHNCS
jgi:hypothetical protein